MDIITSIILGIVQGVTEFLPVSSSGHLVIFGRLLGENSAFEFDVLVNFGTLAALLVYFRARIFTILKDICINHRFDTALKIVLATIPATAVGFFMQGAIEGYLHNTWVVVAMLLIVGIIMVISSKWEPREKLEVNSDVRNISTKQALIIGLSQCLSLVSGTSRSGITILAALRLGFTKERAAEWSFLIGIPIIFGASCKVLLSSDGINFMQSQTTSLVVANLASFLSGMLAIHFLMTILKKYGLVWFGWYRIGLAAVLILLLSAKLI